MFAIFFSIVNILLFLPKKRYDPVLKWLTRLLLTLIGIKVEVEFSEIFDKNETYLFLSNHVNIFDPFLLYGYIPNVVRGVELEAQFKWPIYGRTIARMGNIPIDRENAKKAMQSIKKAAIELRNGNSLIILPEGHRTLDGNLGKLLRGSFVLAKDGGRDIIPIITSGGWEITHRNSWNISPGKIKMNFGKVIKEKDFREITTRELRDLCRLRMEELIKKKESKEHG